MRGAHDGQQVADGDALIIAAERTEIDGGQLDGRRQHLAGFKLRIAALAEIFFQCHIVADDRVEDPAEFLHGFFVPHVIFAAVVDLQALIRLVAVCVRQFAAKRDDRRCEVRGRHAAGIRQKVLPELDALPVHVLVFGKVVEILHAVLPTHPQNAAETLCQLLGNRVFGVFKIRVPIQTVVAVRHGHFADRKLFVRVVLHSHIMVLNQRFKICAHRHVVVFGKRLHRVAEPRQRPLCCDRHKPRVALRHVER